VGVEDAFEAMEDEEALRLEFSFVEEDDADAMAWRR